MENHKPQQTSETADSDNSILAGEPTDNLEENINYVTPYAFGVNESLYGLPLAKPRKRLFALIIDLGLIAMLTKVSYVILFGLYAALLLGVATRLKSKQKNPFARKLVKAVGFLCLFVFALGTIEYAFELNAHRNHADTIAGQTPSSDDSPKLKTLDDYNWEWEAQQQERIDEISESGSDDSETTPELADGFMPWLESNLQQFGFSFGWAAFYFSVLVGFFSGYTPGKRLMNIRVIKLDGTDLTLWDAFGRYGGYGAGFVTGLMGFLQVYWDPNRQAIQDKISSTLVIDTQKPRTTLAKK